MFFLKKLFAQFFFPMPILLTASFIGLYLLWFTQKQRIGKLILTFSLIILTVMSYGFISNPLLKKLERSYPPFISNTTVPIPQNGNEKTEIIKYVIVLGGGHISETNLPVTSQINSTSLVRLIEGIRIYRKHPGSKLILSGGKGFDPKPNAQLMQTIALEIGINPNDIIIENQSKDTIDEAKLVKPIVGKDPFVLVTSAFHIARAMQIFKDFGMNPIPAPVGHAIRERSEFSPNELFPSAGNIGAFERIIKESLGMIWAKLVSRFN